MRRTLALATLAALYCAGCSSDGSDGRPSTARTPGSATGTTSAPPTVDSNGAKTVTFADRDATVWRTGGDPDTLVSAFGSIWVKFDDGEVQRINPANGKVIASIETGYSALPSCDLLGADDHLIWTCAGPNRLFPIDPRSNTAEKPVRASILSDQISLPWSARGAMDDPGRRPDTQRTFTRRLRRDDSRPRCVLHRPSTGPRRCSWQSARATPRL